MCGMVFFSYDIKSFKVYEKDFIPKNKKARSSVSLVQRAKQVLQGIVMISVVISILATY